MLVVGGAAVVDVVVVVVVDVGVSVVVGGGTRLVDMCVCGVPHCCWHRCSGHTTAQYTGHRVLQLPRVAQQPFAPAVFFGRTCTFPSQMEDIYFILVAPA